MKIVKILLWVIGILLLLGTLTYAYYGGFKRVDPQVREEGGELLVYEDMRGDYSKSGALMDSMYHVLLNDAKIETYKGCGIYYDNPEVVEKSELRSKVGCIVEPADTARLTDAYKRMMIPREEYICAEFPNKGVMSIVVGIMKVYPALWAYARENGYREDTPVMEIYDMPNNKIYYRKMLVKE